MTLFALLIAALAAQAPAPSPNRVDSELAAAARREAERRQKAPRGTKSYGDEDLKPPGEAGTAATDPAAAADTAPRSYAAPAERRGPGEPRRKEDPVEDESDSYVPEADPQQVGRPDREPWTLASQEAHGRVRLAQEELGRSRAKREALQQRLNPMSSNYAVDTNDQLQIQSDLHELQAEAKSLEQKLSEAQAALKDLEERARRAGVPGRWLEPEPDSQ